MQVIAEEVDKSSNNLFSGEFSVSVGEGKSRWYFRDRGELSSQAYRFAYIMPTKYAWTFHQTHELKLELEMGVHHWRDSWLEKSKSGVFFTPMWRYYIPALSQSLYFGLGIGLAYTDDDVLMDRELGSRFLFEDKFELGMVIAQKHRVSLSVNHYSNANIADINHGVNYYFVNYAFNF
ncbi:acyloxyacyl hydrolase [Glaciecola petra]|uniref:Acyloxyacyl hydrolase n=1 Tax=Glaciecola petra TaxID=3075602 RepID=A0ABU2ZKX0_9ALTE|nr:acyloxyacyl hydrolase [Aestuariibacter sp. P117]MDT0593265.1 acyloxyacyl hydrolase [Aestuariibacter sp. P117]